MNEDTLIRVSTPVGVTRETSRGEGVGQGTVDGAVLSAINLDQGVNDQFADSEREVWYGDVRLQPMLFQDDVERMATGQHEAQVGNNLMETMAELKLLTFHPDKSVYMVVGSEKNKSELLRKLEHKPLTLNNQLMKTATEYMYLGTSISESGVSESAHLSVLKKAGKVKHLI